jgi:hypothetical protein
MPTSIVLPPALDNVSEPDTESETLGEEERREVVIRGKPVVLGNAPIYDVVSLPPPDLYSSGGARLREAAPAIIYDQIHTPFTMGQSSSLLPPPPPAFTSKND